MFNTAVLDSYTVLLAATSNGKGARTACSENNNAAFISLKRMCGLEHFVFKNLKTNAL